jgi:cytoskeletal protein RodZ
MFASLKMKTGELLYENRIVRTAWAAMPTLGEELKRRREEHGKSLASISATTRIVTRFLKAIEEDNFSVLPGGIFTRSFIRAYAREVGMDEAEATALYLQQTSPQEVQAPAPPAPPEPASEPGPVQVDERANEGPMFETQVSRGFGSRINWPTVATVLAILVLGAVIVLVITRMNREEAGDSGAVATAPKQQARPAPHGAATPAVSQQSGQVPAGSPVASGLAMQVISVKVEATGGQCWVKYQVDDGQHIPIMLEEGQSRSLPDAQNKVTLDIGNRKALTIKINNHEVTFPPNTPNFSAHVIISRDNLQNYLQSNATQSF